MQFYNISAACKNYSKFAQKTYKFNYIKLDIKKVYFYIEYLDLTINPVKNFFIYIIRLLTFNKVFSGKKLAVKDIGCLWHDGGKWHMYGVTRKSCEMDDVMHSHTIVKIFHIQENLLHETPYIYKILTDRLNIYYKIAFYYFKKIKPDAIKDLQSLEKNITQSYIPDNINFLQTVKLQDLHEDKLYLVNYQSHGQGDNFPLSIRWLDRLNQCSSKYTVNHVGLLFYHNRTKIWYIAEQYIDLFLTEADKILQYYNGLLYVTEIEQLHLNISDKNKIYDCREKWDVTISGDDKKTDKSNLKSFAVTAATASYEWQYKDSDNVVMRFIKDIVNYSLDGIHGIFRKLNLESRHKTFCSKSVKKIIENILSKKKSNPYCLKELSEDHSATVKDILHYFLYKDNKTFEEGVKVLTISTNND